jgi:hypothetical protein
MTLYTDNESNENVALQNFLMSESPCILSPTAGWIESDIIFRMPSADTLQHLRFIYCKFTMLKLDRVNSGYLSFVLK